MHADIDIGSESDEYRFSVGGYSGYVGGYRFWY